MKWVEVHERYLKYYKKYKSHDVAIVRLEFEEGKKYISGGLTRKKHYVEPACLPFNRPNKIGKFHPLAFVIMFGLDFHV